MSVGATGADTVWDLLDGRARRDGDKPWLTFLGREAKTTYSAAQIRDRALGVAATLHAAGVARGDRVALLAPNSAEFVVTLFATARIGAVLVPLNWLLTAPELAFQLTDAGAVALIADLDGTARLDDAAHSAGWRGSRFVLAPDHGPWRSLSTPSAGHSSALPAPPAADEVFEIMYTSGSTSNPKGVLLTHRSVVLSAHRMRAEWSVRADDVFLTPLPLFHVNAQMMSTFPALVGDAQLVLQPSFSASEWIDDVRSAGATIVPLVGTQVRMITAQPERHDDSDNNLRCMPYGLNVPMDMWIAFERRFGAPLINTYGLTEGVGAVVSSPLFGDRRPPSLGRVHLDRHIGVFDDDGNPVVGCPGEIRVQGIPGETLMAGYHNRPQATAEALRDGWLHTGDVGIIDEDGYLSYVDRAKDVIKRNGENVSSLEVETVLVCHPSVAEAAVVGRPDPIRDEEVVAFVLAAQGAVIDRDALTEFCAGRLAKFKVPTEIIELESMPRSTVGKLEKKTLRALLDDVTAGERGI